MSIGGGGAPGVVATGATAGADVSALAGVAGLDASSSLPPQPAVTKAIKTTVKPERRSKFIKSYAEKSYRPAT
jgi:hypothetical protein